MNSYLPKRFMYYFCIPSTFSVGASSPIVSLVYSAKLLYSFSSGCDTNLENTSSVEHATFQQQLMILVGVSYGKQRRYSDCDDSNSTNSFCHCFTRVPDSFELIDCHACHRC